MANGAAHEATFEAAYGATKQTTDGSTEQATFEAAYGATK
jgi:hypothetical protein